MALEQNTDKTPLRSGKHKLPTGSSWLPLCPQLSWQAETAAEAATLLISSKNRQQNEREKQRSTAQLPLDQR